MRRPARIAYVTPYLLPHVDASVQQFFYTLAALARHGFIIDVLVTQPANGHRTPPHAEELAAFYGLPIGTVRLLSIVSVGSTPVDGNQARGFVHGVRAAAYVRDRSYDLVYTRSWNALVPALFMNLPAVFDTYRTDLNTLRRFAVWRRLCYSRPNLLGVITHSELARRSFVAAGIPAGRVLRAYNGHEPGMFQPVLSVAEARRSLGLPEKARIVVYAGSLRPDKGTDALLSVAEALPDTMFLLVGGEPRSADRTRFAERARARNVGNLRFMPLVPPSQVTAFLYAADCLIIPPSARAWNARRTVLPMKTFSYLAAGRPIVAPDLPDVREVLVDGRNARLVPPDDTRAAASAIHSLLADPLLRERLGRQARTDAGQYTWDTRASRIADFLATLLDHTTTSSSGRAGASFPHASR